MVDTASIKRLGSERFFHVKFKILEDIIFNTDDFHQLVFPDATKEIVRVMVNSHVHVVDFVDFTRGKGKRLIMLHHGPPGLAVAEYSQRPLYTITSSELSAKSDALENHLSRALHIAKAFLAVLLLDEADVFMEERSTKKYRA
ncbi:hypothetical protein BBP40_009067 [Aspergillus hancockii]|nr:hypothetical protein BBP40_009067 [Aspergillus hancockii]